MSEVRKEIINRLTKLVDQRKNLAGEIKYDNCIVSTTDLDFLLNMINEDSYISKQKVKDKIEELDIAILECEYDDNDIEEYKNDMEKAKRKLLIRKNELKELLEDK